MHLGMSEGEVSLSAIRDRAIILTLDGICDFATKRVIINLSPKKAIIYLSQDAAV